MPSLNEMYADLEAADSAGDFELAKVIASKIKQAQAEPKKPLGQPVMRKGPEQQLPTPGQAALSAAGQAVTDLGAGLVRGAGSIGSTIVAPGDWLADKMMGDRDRNLSGLVTGEQPMTRNQERRAKIDQGLQSLVGARPESIQYGAGKIGGEIAGTLGVGGTLGNLVGRAIPAAAPLAEAVTTGGFRAGGMTGPGGILTRAAGGALTGGASAGLVDPEQAGMGAAIGGALPPVAMAAGATGRALGNKLRGGEVSPAVVELADRAKSLGIDIPADRIAQSKPMDALASSLNYLPFSGRAGTEEKMVKQMDAALSRTLGEDTPDLAKAISKASTRLSGEFDRVLSGTNVAVDTQMMDDLTNLAGQAQRELGSDSAKVILNQIDEIMAKGGGDMIDGKAAYNIKKALDRIGNRMTPEAYYARELKKSLMGALERSLGPEEAANFAATRRQYGNMLDLEPLVLNRAEGGASVARVANLRNVSPEVREVAKIAGQFLKPREGQHGAAQRALVGLAAGSTVGLPALAAGAATGRAANVMLNSELARNAMLGRAVPSGILEQLAPPAYRTAPLMLLNAMGD